MKMVGAIIFLAVYFAVGIRVDPESMSYSHSVIVLGLAIIAAEVA